MTRHRAALLPVVAVLCMLLLASGNFAQADPTRLQPFPQPN